jgi:Fe-S-cluster containining protein
MEPCLHERFRSIAAAYESEFARNRDLHGPRIRCAPGCSDCCHQLFQITEVEAAVVSRAVADLNPSPRDQLRRRATEYIARRANMLGSAAAPEAWGSLPPPGTRLPCPALYDGRCSIYEHRPIICRKFGMPLWNPDKPGRVYACELNFAPGEAIEDGRLIQIHTALHRDWKRLQRDYNEAGGYRDPQPLTVARAILEDFHLP